MIATTSTPAPVPTIAVASLAPAPVMTTFAPVLASDATPAVAALTTPTSSSNNMPTPVRHKGLLYQYIQKESLPPPIYKTVNEGSEHLPRFRSTVTVGEEQFTSPNVFLHIKEAEHDVSKIALESLRTRVKEEDFSIIHESTVFCKSILYEYAIKMQLERPVYNTVQTCLQPSSFVSSLVINGVTHVGKSARSKKEAEQLVAQAVLLAIIGGGESESKTTLSKIISSKSKCLAALPKNDGFQNGESSGLAVTNPVVPVIATTESVQGVQPEAQAKREEMKLPVINLPSNVEQPIDIPPHHTFSLGKGEAVQEKIQLPIVFVPSNYVLPANVGQGSAKRKKKKNKKKGAKKMRTES